MHILYSTVLLEEQIAAHSAGDGVASAVESVLNSPKSIMATIGKTGDGVDQATRRPDSILLVSNLRVKLKVRVPVVEENARKRLRHILMLRAKQMATQKFFAQQKKKKLEMTIYHSPIVWVLALKDPHDVLEIKKWYDETYKNRFENAKKKWNEIIELIQNA